MNPRDIIARFEPRQDNLLNMLHALQDSHPENYITSDAMDEVARYLNMTKSSVFGVVDYYSMFSLRPRGRYIIRVCVSPVCHIKKAGSIISHLENILGIKTGETTPDKLFTLEIAECLGQCQEAPSMMINQKVYNNLTDVRIREIIALYK